MNTLQVRNWNKWQSYRSDRGQPPWIKVHRALMRDPNWVSLSDAQRGQLVAIWLLAADRDGVIPASPSLIQKLCFMESPPDLKALSEQGFINGVKAASVGGRGGANVTAQSRVEESREEVDKQPRRQDDVTTTPEPESNPEVIKAVFDELRDQEDGEAEDPSYVQVTDEDREVAGRELRRLQKAVQRLDPNASFDNFHQRDEMLRIRAAGYDWAQVKAVIMWATKDPFWQGQIISPAKLHKHMSTLVAKMAADGGSGGLNKAAREKWAQGGE